MDTVSYVCKYGHKHRTATGVEYCELVTPWREKESLIETIPWEPEGTTEEWCDVGRFQGHIWGLMRWHIIRRDRVCQYKQCGIVHEQRYGGWHHHTLEVHHIIPRRLGGTDHPTNLVALCHDHHRIQPSHHHDAGLVICDADIPPIPLPPRRIRQARPECERTLFDFGVGVVEGEA